MAATLSVQHPIGQMSIPSIMAHNSILPNREAFPKMDLLTTCATDLQKLLAAGEVSSVQLVEQYLAQINDHDRNGLQLHAMISVAPISSLTEKAQLLDNERREGKLRGPFHGIPIVVKDNIMTGPEHGMDTTCGSQALVGAKAKNAPMIESLLKAGMLVIGKTNLSEWSGCKGFPVTAGWSAVAGQTQSPYVKGGYVNGDKILGHSTPCGSSSGSAVAVAAGFAPIALGTESDGSVTQPAGRASLYALKATVGAVSTAGSSPHSPLTDSLGGLAKSSEDLAILTGILMNQNFSGYLTKSWSGLKVAFVDPKLWELDPAVCDHDEKLLAKQRAEIANAVQIIKDSGARVVEDVFLPQIGSIKYKDGDAIEAAWSHDFGPATNAFLAEYDEANVRNIQEVYQYNLDHADVELPSQYPSQSGIEGALSGPGISDAEYEEAVAHLRLSARTNGFDRIFEENGVDLLMGPLDGRIVSVAAAAGYPVGVVPLGYADEEGMNGRAYGVVIAAAAGQEGKILEAMSAWEAVMPRRQPPPLLANWKASPSL